MTGSLLGNRLRLFFFLALGAVALLSAGFARAAETKPSASVIKVEGGGSAKIKRKSGQEIPVGVPIEIYAGDKVLTDANSLVELLLPDGSIVRIGFNSEYKVETVERKAGFISWVFGLAKGSVRALVEKSGDKKNVRFRINTPAGTMGVRGTEFLLEHDEKAATTRLFTFHGLVEFGPVACAKGQDCVEVGARKMSTINKGEKRAVEPKDFSASDLFRPAPVKDGTVANTKAGEAAKARLSLLNSAKEAEKTADGLQRLSDAELEKVVAEGGERLQNAQDVFLGRDEELRKAEHAAKEAGTFDDTVALGKRALKSQKIPDPQDRPNNAYRDSKRFKLGSALADSLLSKDKGRVSGERLKAKSSLSGLESLNHSKEDLERAQQIFSQMNQKVAVQEEHVARSMAALAAMEAPSRDNKESDCNSILECTRGDMAAAGEHNHTSAAAEKDYPELSASTGANNTRNRETTNSGTNNTILRGSNSCYTTQRVCTTQVTGCDLRSGRKCTKTNKSSTCTEKKVSVSCSKDGHHKSGHEH